MKLLSFEVFRIVLVTNNPSETSNVIRGIPTQKVCLQVGVMAAVGKGFGLSLLQSVRAGLLLAAGGEFAFVTFGEAVSHKILPQALVSKLFLIVSLSMALTPFLAEFGQRLGKMFEKSDVKVSSGIDSRAWPSVQGRSQCSPA